MSRIFIIIAALSGFLAVVIGAFAAHKLKQQLSPEMLQVMQTGVQYQMYHALALPGGGNLMAQQTCLYRVKSQRFSLYTGQLFFQR